MSSLVSIPVQTFSSTELQEIYIIFQNPLLRKYLTFLAVDAVVSIATGSRQEGQSAEAFLEERARVQGGMLAIETLLAMQSAPVSES